jgi:putative FmdB family regulatory protein
MPIYEIDCQECGQKAETLVLSGQEELICPNCGGKRTTKMMSVPSSYGRQETAGVPGPMDTACCGSSPAETACAGPGSCCGKRI